MKKIFIGAIAFCIYSSCDEQVVVRRNTNPAFQAITSGSLLRSSIKEGSGLASSYKYPGFYWTHNDSGDSARIFLIDSTGNIKARVTLSQTVNRDWEDIAIFKDPDSGLSYVYIADVGDNFLNNKLNYIYRIQEPELPHGLNQKVTVKNIQKMIFTYPDGQKDSESILLDPVTSAVFVINKSDSETNIYTFPDDYSFGDTATLNKEGQLPVNGLVSGSISSDSKSILLKSYSNIYYWERSPETTITETLQSRYKSIPYQLDPQGEAICWHLNNKDFLTITECVSNLSCNIRYYKRLE